MLDKIVVSKEIIDTLIKEKNLMYFETHKTHKIIMLITVMLMIHTFVRINF
jgi:hypothetical protein